MAKTVLILSLFLLSLGVGETWASVRLDGNEVTRAVREWQAEFASYRHKARRCVERAARRNWGHIRQLLVAHGHDPRTTRVSYEYTAKGDLCKINALIINNLMRVPLE